jgi:hypothetical protein
MLRRWIPLTSLGFAALAAIAALWTRALPLESLLLRAAAIDQNVRNGLLQLDVYQLRRVIRFQVIFWSIVASGIPWLFLIPSRVSVRLRPRLFQLSITLGCSSALFLLLASCGFEAPWYPLTVLMKNPGSLPVFGHRLLWVWVADLVQKLIPSLSYTRCYLLSQIVPIVLTVIMIGKWSELFIDPSLRWVGQVLLVPMLAPTFGYFTFYDISIVFFYALCLYLLHQRRYLWFAIAVGVATFNHENALLLVVLAGLETFREKFRVCAVVTLGSLLLHLAARFAMQWAIPSTRLVDWRIWTNLVYPLIHPQMLIEAALVLMFWWLAAAVCWEDAEPFLRRAALLLPMLLTVTFLFGQLHEARQFNAMIPVLIAFILSANAELIKNQEN